MTTPSNCTLTNGSATATVSGGASTNYTYIWDDPVPQTNNPATGLANGPIGVTVTETSLGCTVTNTDFVLPIDGPTVTLNSIVDATCFGGDDGSIDVTTTGGSTPTTLFGTLHLVVEVKLLKVLHA